MAANVKTSKLPTPKKAVLKHVIFYRHTIVVQTQTNMATTPVKVAKIDCFVCLAANVKTFKLRGKKLTIENFENKLVKFLGREAISQMIYLKRPIMAMMSLKCAETVIAK